MSNTVITVSNAAGLMSALAGATGGETIQLQPGNYGRLALWNGRETFLNNYTSAVTITSANPDDLAFFTSVALKGVKNLSFDSVKFDYTAAAGALDWVRTFYAEGCTGIIITNSVFDGDLASGRGENFDGYGTGYGLSVRDAANISITDNVFFNWARAGIFGSVDNLNVVGNEIFGIRSDGLDFANVDNVLIENNHIHDFATAPNSGDHPDMIQFWTRGTTSPSTNVVIRGNILNSGHGGETQSIFMRNEVVDTGAAGDAMFYQNITIEDNVIHNAHAHGITVGETNGLTIENNTILHNRDAGNDGLVHVPTVNVAAASTQVAVINNILPRLPSIPSAGALVANNLIVQSDFPDGANYVGDLFVDALAGAHATLADLQAIPGGILEQMGVGSSLTNFSTQPAAPVGFIVDDAGSGLSLLTHSLDASNLYGPNGKINLQGASVVWNFGDGTSASGVAVDHAFAHAGSYDVTATITLVGGTVAQVDRTISVQTPVALQANFDNGAQDLSDITNSVTVGTGVTFEPGASGQAIRLNGGLVTYRNGPELLNNSEYTLLFDFKKDPGQEAAAGGVIYFSGSVVVNISSNGLSAAIVTDQASKWLIASNLGINDADWHKVALTFSGNDGSAILYLDGAAVGRVDGLGSIQVGSSGQNFNIGNPWGNSFPGLIDNVAFLKGSLSAQDVADGWTSQSHGSSGNTINGTAAADFLTGSSQDDRINGGGNADLMQGLGGNDWYYVDHAGDRAIELVGGGNDLVLTSVSYALEAGSEIESLTTNSAGSTNAINLTGNAFANTFIGNAGNNIINGGGNADLMQGLGGNDWYYVDHAGDRAIELVGGGSDKVYSSTSYALQASAAVEVLATTNAALTTALNLTGNGFSQTVQGNAGANVINGGVNASGQRDLLSGFGGNDSYYVDGTDLVYEAVGGGSDKVYASTSYALQASAAVEVLATTNAALTTALNLTGNGFSQTVQGNAGANVINGGVNASGQRDLLSGFGGNDSYYVDGTDLVYEAVGGGSDKVYASTSYALQASAAVEVLATTNAALTTALNLTGNGFSQTVQGNAGANVINGGVNASGQRDLLSGFGGNDSYYVDGTDLVYEAVGGGSDKVYASTSYALQASAAVEVLATTNAALTTALNLTGNGFSQTVQGNAGANVINGGVNASGQRDLLSGFGGNDSYYVDGTDLVYEAVGGGSDKVYASTSYALQASAAVEVLATTNAALTTALNLTGNGFSQTVQGNAGANVINGGVNASGQRDLLSGFGGNDSYYVDGTDLVYEAVGGGSDKVYASTSYALQASAAVEVLATTNAALTTALNLTGNGFSQTVQGNAGANVINGGVNASGQRDLLSGFGGNDSYYVDGTDLVYEAVGGGSDKVYASTSYALQASAAVEVLATTNAALTTALNLTGNGLSQTVQGNAGANVINGGVNASGQRDFLYGFGGNDSYYVDGTDLVYEAVGGGSDKVYASTSYALQASAAVEVLATTNAALTTALNLTGNGLSQTVQGNAGANVINGGAGNDVLQGLGGSDSFHFNTALNAATNVDTVTDFVVVDDTFLLENAVFTGLAAGTLTADAFHIGAAAADAEDRIIYNNATGHLIFDSNGNVTGGATQFAALSTGLLLTNSDFLLI